MKDTTKKQTITCQQCNGTGQEQDEERGSATCHICDGAGQFNYEMIAEYSRQIDYFRKLAEDRLKAIRQVSGMAERIDRMLTDMEL